MAQFPSLWYDSQNSKKRGCAMSNELEAIKNKIEKLLNLAENNSSVNESEVALAKAKQLLDEYNISRSDLFNTPQKAYSNIIMVSIPKGNTSWRESYLHILAIHNYCKIILGRHSTYIFGEKNNIDLVLAMYHNTLDHIESLCAIAFARDGRGYHGRGWKNSWYRGFTQGLNDNLRRAKNIKQAQNNTSIQIYNTQAIDLKIKEQFGKTKSTRRSISSDNAYYSGVKTGQNYSNPKLLHD